MHRNLLLYVAVAAISIFSFYHAVAQNRNEITSNPIIRVATWNLQNFTDVPGSTVFPDRGPVRRARDLAAILKYMNIVSPDVIALQEISSRSAMRFLLPDLRYNIFLPQHAYSIDANNTSNLFTGIAVNSRHLSVGGVEELGFLRIPYEENDLTLHTRSGLSVYLENAQVSFLFVSVHLKADCADVRRVTTSVSTACRLLLAQARALGAWLTAKARSEARIFVAGTLIDVSREKRTKFGKHSWAISAKWRRCGS